jgi:peptidoglycan hydrolase-like protein with peptidoglycan-binding domain
MSSVRRAILIAMLTVGVSAAPAVVATAGATAASHASAAKPKATAWPIVRKGATGGRVRAIQYLLNQRINAKLKVDGSFGTSTQAAVKSFQRKVKISVDGVVGPTTWTKLIITVKKGSKGNAVRAVQWQLRNQYGYKTLAVDGNFGTSTQSAVKGFQKKYKLSVDGIVGNATWMALESH